MQELIKQKTARREMLRAELAQIRAQLADLARGEQQYLGRLAEVEADLRALTEQLRAPLADDGEQSKDAPTPPVGVNEGMRAHGVGQPEWAEEDKSKDGE